jgi:hypothetical protein
MGRKKFGEFGKMADPASLMMVVSAASTILATGVSAIAGSNQAQAQAAASRQSAQYAYAMAKRNQEIANIAAGRERSNAAYQAGLMEEQKKKLLSRQIAAYSAAGVDLTGSPLEFMSQTSAEAERDILATRAAGEYSAWKYETGGETSLLEGEAAQSRYLSEAGTYDARATAALVGGGAKVLGQGTSLLTGYIPKTSVPSWDWPKGSSPYTF